MTPAEFRVHFNMRVLEDSFSNALADHWLKRAEVFEWTKPRLDDFHGLATREELSARWRRAHRDAETCRRFASLAREGALTPLEIWDVLQEGGELWQDEAIPHAS